MEDVAKRVTKAVLHYEEKTTNDLEKLRDLALYGFCHAGLMEKFFTEKELEHCNIC